MDSVTWAAGLEACATAVAAGAAIVAGIYAGKAFKGQREQLERQMAFETRQSEVMALQAQELRESLLQRRRAQATRVSLDHSREARRFNETSTVMGISTVIRNRSDLPIFDVEFVTTLNGNRWHGGAGPAVIGPETNRQKDIEITLSNVAVDDIDVWAEFRDQAGRWWRIRTGGLLEDITEEKRRALEAPAVPHQALDPLDPALPAS